MVETIAPIFIERYPHAKNLAEAAKILDRQRLKADEKTIDCCCICSGLEEAVNLHANDDDIFAISLLVETHVAFASSKTSLHKTRMQ